MRFVVAVRVFVFVASIGGSFIATAAPPERDWFPKAPPLPVPRGQVIRVSDVAGLFAAVQRVKPGGTILLADGRYKMPRYIAIATDNVTLRSASGNRHGVILDGADSRHGELLGFRNCSGVTVADLTIQNVKHNGFKINSETNVQNLRIYNCVIHNIWQRGFKAVAVPEKNRETIRPRNHRIEYCLFYNDRPKQFADDPTDTPKTFNGDYIGGIDVMYADGWTISDNVFLNIQGRTRQGRGAIFVWVDSRDCTIQRNIVVGCDTGICLGNSYIADKNSLHGTRMLVRNNFVTRCPEAGIFAAYTRDCKIVHNTIHDPDNRLKRLIRLVHNNDGLLVANNLLSGPPMRNETKSKVLVRDNVTEEMPRAFRDPDDGDLHLIAVSRNVVNAAVALQSVADDIDGDVRDAQPDVGADEFSAVAQAKTSKVEKDSYVAAMRKIAAGFRGKQGVVIHVGDSITYANPYGQWARYGKGRTVEDRAVLKWMHAGADDNTDGWYLARVDRPGGRSDTAAGGIRVDQMLAGGRRGMPALKDLLTKYQPQIVVLMLGTNDASAGRKLADYSADMARAVDLILARKTICILSTIPPHPHRLELAKSYNQALRKLAKDKGLPLIDYEREILQRRPNDWNGTLLGKNDVHPTARQGGVSATDAPTPENLRNSGYLLRCWLSVRKIAEVKRRVIDAQND